MVSGNDKKRNIISTGVLLEFLLSFMIILFGGTMLLYADIPVVFFFYVFAFLLLIVGFIMITGYFKRKEYMDISKYGFSVGLFFMFAGICLFVRAADFEKSYIEFFGLLLLINSVILFQYAIQMFMMEGKAAGLVMFFTVIEMAFAVVSVINPLDLFYNYPKVAYVFLTLCGMFGLLSMLLVKFRHYNLKKEQDRDKKRMLEEEPVKEDDKTVPSESLLVETGEVVTLNEPEQNKEQPLIETKDDP